jgi:hypothetical protein
LFEGLQKGIEDIKQAAGKPGEPSSGPPQSHYPANEENAGHHQQRQYHQGLLGALRRDPGHSPGNSYQEQERQGKDISHALDTDCRKTYRPGNPGARRQVVGSHQLSRPQGEEIVSQVTDHDPAEKSGQTHLAEGPGGDPPHQGAAENADRKKRYAQSEEGQVDLPESRRQLAELDAMEGNDEKDNGQRQTNCYSQIFTFLQWHFFVHNLTTRKLF